MCNLLLWHALLISFLQACVICKFCMLLIEFTSNWIDNSNDTPVCLFYGVEFIRDFLLLFLIQMILPYVYFMV